ncbi:MAG: LysE family transporter [Oscillospiraceae bacterium]|nr:LysE family transporter [Oscillospiraceae bacterium]
MFRWGDFLIYCFVCAYTPGANNLLAMGNAAKLGFRKTLSFCFGITAGFLIVMTVCAVFTTTLFSLIPSAMFYMKILGAAYLLYLAWKVWRSSAQSNGNGDEAQSFLTGMLLQFTNIKIMIYGVTNMSLYIMPVYQSAAAMVLFVLLLTVIGSSGSFAWAAFGSVFWRVFQKHEKAINLILALVLVYCAAALFFP